MVRIDRGIPVPSRSHGQIYPWHLMQVGDSFLFPPGTQFPSETARAYSRRNPDRQFTARKTREGYRCWRIA